MRISISFPRVSHTWFICKYYVTFLCTWSIVVIVNNWLIIVSFFRIIWNVEARSHRSELTVHHQVIEHIGQGILFYIHATAFFTVTTPSCIDNGIVVCLDFCHITCVTLTRTGEFQTVSVRAEHDVSSYIDHTSCFYVHSFCTIISICSKHIVSDDGISTHQINTIWPTVTQYRVGNDIMSIDVIGCNLRIGIVSSSIHFRCSSRRTFHNLTSCVFNDCMVNQHFFTSGWSHNTSPETCKNIFLCTFIFWNREQDRLFSCTFTIQVSIYGELYRDMIGSYSCCTYNDFHTFLDYKAFAFGHCVMVGQIYYRIGRPDNDVTCGFSISTISIFIVISIVIVSGSLSSIPVCNRVFFCTSCHKRQCYQSRSGQQIIFQFHVVII